MEDAAQLLRKLREENEELRRKLRALVEHCRRRHGCDAMREIEDD
jgi:predicted small metal-binding protein